MFRARNLPPIPSAWILLQKRTTGKAIKINRLSSKISSRQYLLKNAFPFLPRHILFLKGKAGTR